MAMDVLKNMKELFYTKLAGLLENKSRNSGFMTKQKYMDQINMIMELKNKRSGKTPEEYQKLRRYDIIKVGDSTKLIYPVDEAKSNNIRYYVYNEEIFDLIHQTHTAIGHGGRNKMMKELQKKYKNITSESVMLYINLCEPCQKKSKVPKKGLVIGPTVFKEMNSRCQVDLIDMQSQEDKDFKFILVYQDHLTKFVQLRPLKTKQAKEVAYVLLDIFTIFGAPSVLQSDNGREFASKIVKELCSAWNELKIVHGKPRHSQSQGSVERASQDIENMLCTWLESNQTTNWSEGLRFVQLMKNRAYHQGIKCSPYEAMFGSPIKVGLKNSSLPNETIMNLNTEEELEIILQNINKNNGGDGNDINTENVEIVEISRNNNDTNSNTNEESEEEIQLTTIPNNKNKDGISGLLGCSSVKEQKSLILEKRKMAKTHLEIQAAKMKKMSMEKCPAGNIGDTVRVRIPDVDQARSDPRNCLAVIMAVQDDQFYELGTEQGKLSQFYSRNEEKVMQLKEVPDVNISLREYSRKSSLCGEQGYKRCFCKGKCTSKKCSCKNNSKLCNTKCHNSLSCDNK